MAVQYVSIGREVDGDPAMVCPHLAAWWPVYTDLVDDRLGVALEIIQAKGQGSQSGGTHADGTALDLRTWRFTSQQVLVLVALAREMGARATWYRTKAQGFDPHIHLVLDCPCKSAADYQTAAVDQGYNGLGAGGRGGRDTHPAPSTRRDYAAGIAWATNELNGGLTVSQITELKAAIAALAAKVDYNTAQLKAIDGKANGRARMNSDAAATASVVKGALVPIARTLDAKPDRVELAAAVDAGIAKALADLDKE